MVLVSLLQHINLYLIDDTVLYGQRHFQCLSLDVCLVLNAWLNTTPSLAHSKVMVLGAGILACLDGYMNIAMEQTEEYVNGQLKNKYGDAFIRGNNGNTSFFPCQSSVHTRGS
jgi:hypothetical protein